MIQHKPQTTAKPLKRTLYDKQLSNGRTLALDGAAWRTLRAAVLREQPLCEHCMDNDDRPIMATDVDHIDNDPTNNDRSNLASLCHACHSRKTNAEMGHKVAWGCDAQGMPLDPNHPWNLEKSPATDGHKPSGTLYAQGRS